MSVEVSSNDVLQSKSEGEKKCQKRRKTDVTTITSKALYESHSLRFVILPFVVYLIGNLLINEEPFLLFHHYIATLVGFYGWLCQNFAFAFAKSRKVMMKGSLCSNLL